MSRELIENLREYADIAEAGEKSHWALAMRQAAEYIRADLEKTLPEPVGWQNKFGSRMSRERELLKKALLVLPYVSLDVITYAINAEIQSLIAEIESEMSKPLPKPIGWQNKLKPSEFYEYEQLDPLWQNEFRPLYAEPQASKPLTEPVQSRTKKYFSYYPEGGFELHNSAEEAKKSAEDALDTEREYACEGWSEYVDKICWGEVRQHVVETMRRPRTDEDTFISSDFDTVVDYGLVDIGGDNGNT